MDTRLTVAQAGRWRIWRLIAALGTAAVVASVGISACSDDAVAPSLATSSAGAAHDARGELSLQDVGEFHNAFLDFAFPRMRAAVGQRKSRAELCVVIAQAMRDFVAARKLRIDPGFIRNDIAGGDCVDHSSPAAAGGKPRFALAVDDVPIGELDVVIGDIALATAEDLPLSSLGSVVNDRVAYARTYFPVEEADVVAATGEIALASAGYWDQNFSYYEQILLEEAGLTETVTRIGTDSPRISASGVSARGNAPFAAPERRSDGWRTDIENSSWYPRARKVAVADITGAVRGGVSGWRGGWSGILAGAAVEAGAASAGGLLREVFKPWIQ